MTAKFTFRNFMVNYLIVIMVNIDNIYSYNTLISKSNNNLIITNLLKVNASSFSFISTLFLGSVGAGVLLIIMIIVIICICKSKNKDEIDDKNIELAEPVVEASKVINNDNIDKSSKFFYNLRCSSR